MAKLMPLCPSRENSQTVHFDLEGTLHQQTTFSIGSDEKPGSCDLCSDFQWNESASEAQYISVPGTAHTANGHVYKLTEWGLDQEVEICYEEEKETVFNGVDDAANESESWDDFEEIYKENLSLHSSNDLQEGIPELPLLPEDDCTSESSGKSVDYGFISAVTFLVTGISLVVISYTISRDVKVNPDSISAREMERLQRENARVGAHLDRCVIAGLSLLTLGGAILSTLLMVSIHKGEMVRRQALAYSKQSSKLYGSINFRGGGSPTGTSSHFSLDEDDLLVDVAS